jgi:hypothetical protein
MTREFEMKFEGVTYQVKVCFSRRWEDDSFDCHINGRPGTHECGHWEADIDTLQVVSCTDAEGQDEDPCWTEGLQEAIEEKVAELDCDD